ncbi:polyprenyl synthetase family protein [Eisenbergiella sp.]
MKNVIEEAEKLLDARLVEQNKQIQSLYRIYGINDFVSMNGKGKRLRGRLVLIGYIFAMDLEDISKLPEEVIVLAMCLEILQTSVLVQDDVIDGDEERRKQRALHIALLDGWKDEKKAAEAAILIGNIGVCYVYKLLRETFSDREALLKEFDNMLFTTLYGEVLDIVIPLQERKRAYGNETREKYALEIARRKTAYYSFVSPLAMGFMLAEACPKSDIEWVKNLGEDMGMAYQLENDLRSISEMEQKNRLPRDIVRYRVTYANSVLAQNERMKAILLQGVQKTNGTLEEISMYAKESGWAAAVRERENVYLKAAHDKIFDRSDWGDEKKILFWTSIRVFFRA